MSKQGRLLFAAGLAGLGVGALNLFVQGITEVLKGGSFRDAAKEAFLTSGIIALGTGGATLGALALMDACPMKALVKR